MLNPSLPERTIAGLHDHLLLNLPSVDFDFGILDIGCGSGAWLERLAAKGFNKLYGIDLDIHQVKTQVAQIYQINLDKDIFEPECKFHLITAIEVKLMRT